MRLATLILGIMIGLLAILVGFITILGDTEELQSDGRYGAGLAIYFIVMLAWAVAIAFVIPWPAVAVVAFGGSAVLCLGFALILTEATTYAGFLVVWGVASGILGAFSLFGWIGKRQQEQAIRQHHKSQQFGHR